MNGSVKGVSSGIVDEIFDGAFEDSKDTVDCFRGAFDKVKWGWFLCRYRNCQLVCIHDMNCLHNRVYYKSFAV